MEALTLLRYWRNNGGHQTTSNATVTSSISTASTGNTTTIVTGVSSHASETDEIEVEDENDHGPFFDLEFSLPTEKDGAEENETNVEVAADDDEDSDGSDDSDNTNESELKITLMSSSSGDSTADVNVSVSPSDELFFNGGFVPVDRTTEMNSKPQQFRLPLMKSATKFRVMMLKFRKMKLNTESTESSTSTASNTSSSSNSKKEKEEYKQDQTGESTDSGKSMTVKFVEEVPIVNLFKRHNSSKRLKKPQNESETVSGASSEKKITNERIHKYFEKVKPLYVRVSQKYGEKLKLAGTFTGVTKPNFSSLSSSTEEQKDSSQTNPRREKQSSSEVVAEPPLLSSTTELKHGNLPAGLRVVCKHFGKTWSASAIATTTATAATSGATPSKRRDDTLLQQQDGIQSAILHCKRSFKATRDSDSSSGEPVPAAGKCESGWDSGAAEGGETEAMKK